MNLQGLPSLLDPDLKDKTDEEKLRTGATVRRVLPRSYDTITLAEAREILGIRR